MTGNERPISEDDLHAYVDGVLDQTRRADVERYLSEHPEAAARVDGWQVANEALRRAVAWKAAEPVPARLNVAHLANSRLGQRWVPWRMAASILVALAIGAGGGWMAHTPTPDSGIAAVVREAAMAQRVFASDHMHPVEFAADQQAQLVNWVSARLGRAVVPPDLSRSGYQLLGGRVVATEHGPASMFLYQNADGSRMTLFVRPMEKIDMNAKMEPVRTADTTGYAWAKNGLGFSLLANHPMTRLHDLANQVRSDMGSEI